MSSLSPSSDREVGYIAEAVKQRFRRDLEAKLRVMVEPVLKQMIDEVFQNFTLDTSMHRDHADMSTKVIVRVLDQRKEQDGI